MPTYKLKYFDLRARAEFIRYMLVLKGVDFEDSRIKGTWATEKPKTPFGQVPVLTIDGEEFTESHAIARYLAREFGFYGKTNKDGFEIDRMMGLWQDVLDTCTKSHFEKDEKVKAEKEKDLKEKTFPRFVGIAEKILSSRSNKGYCVGDSLTLGDAAIYDMVDGRLTDEELEKYPCVKAVVNNFGSNDKIRAYIAKTGKRPI